MDFRAGRSLNGIMRERLFEQANQRRFTVTISGDSLVFRQAGRRWRMVGAEGGTVCRRQWTRAIRTNGRHKERHRVFEDAGFSLCPHKARDQGLGVRIKRCCKLCRAAALLPLGLGCDVKRSERTETYFNVEKISCVARSLCYAFTFCALRVEGNPVFAKILDLCPERKGVSYYSMNML